MKSWKSRVRSVVFAIARSTCSSPSTSRRTAMPASWSFTEELLDQSVELLGLLDASEVRGGLDRLEPRVRDRVGDYSLVCGRRRGTPPGGDPERRRRDRLWIGQQIHV